VKANRFVLSSRRPGYDLGSVHVRVVVDEMALGRGVFSEYFGLIL
jgi:hypothetical protein